MTTVAPALERAPQGDRPRTSPYQGLEPYSEEDAAYFFGRSAWREIICDHLLGYRVTVLYGASGVGKSSVLHAGVVDELRRQAVRNREVSGLPELLPVILSRWSSDPLVSLTEAIQVGAAAIAPELADDPPQGSLAEILAAWSERIGGHVLVILDQFDEYFTYYERGPFGSAFADELVEAITDRDVPAHFLFSIREDALAKLDLFEDRIADLWQNLLRIEHLDHVAAKEAIERPVARWNEREAADGETIELEPGLVEAVLSEAEPESVHADKAGSGRIELTEEGRAVTDFVEAPYLQLVMSRLWEEERGNGSSSLRIETLRRLGGGDRIFRNHFDSVMKSLPRRQRSVAARVFQYLVTPHGTKIALPPSALAKWAKQKESKVASVLETLAAGERRILRTVSGGEEAETSYEIFHDRLAAGILDWRRRYGRRRTIRRALLLFVPPLAVALFVAVVVIGFQRSENADLSGMVAFLRAQNEVAAAAQGSPRLGAILPPQQDGVSSVAVSPDGRRIATTSYDGTVDVSRTSVQDGEFDADPERPLNVDSAALSVFSPDGRLLGIETGNAWAGVWGPTGKKRFQIEASSDYASLAFTPDGKKVLTALDDGTAHLWDVRTGKSVAVFRAPEESLDSAAISRSGDRVVTIAGTTARVWDVTRPRRLGVPFETQTDLIYAGLSPDGRSLLTVSAGGTRLWDVRSHHSVAPVGAGPGSDGGFGYDSAVADFAPDGRFALAGRRAVPLYSKSGQLLIVLRGHTSPTTVVRFSPDGRLVATGDGTGAVRVWDTSTGQSRALLTAHKDAITSLAFSPPHGFLVTGASDGMAIVWLFGDVAQSVEATARTSPSFVAMLPSHFLSVNSVAVSTDGGQGYRFVTTSEDGTVAVSAAPNVRAGALQVFRDRVLQIELAHLALFSPDGSLLGVETGDAWAGVWGQNGKKRFEIPASSDSLSLAFTPDGSRVLTALEDGTAHLWDARSGKSVAVFRSAEKPLTTASLSRDGRLLVTVGGKIARVWEVGRQPPLGTVFRLSSRPVYAALSPDGRSLLTLSAGDTRLWDVRTHRNVRLAGVGPEPGGDFDYELADFALDGHFAIAGRRPVPIYDRSGQLLIVLRGHTAPTTVVRFSPDGQLVATGDRTGAVRVWDTSTGQSRAVLTAHFGPVTALAFSPDGRFLATAAADGTAIVWRVPAR